VINRINSVIKEKMGRGALGESHYIIMWTVPVKRRFRLLHGRTYIIVLHITTWVRETHKSLIAAAYIFFYCIARFSYNNNILYIRILRSVHDRLQTFWHLRNDWCGRSSLTVYNMCIFIQVYGRYVVGFAADDLPGA